MNWTSYKPLCYKGQTYGQKDVEFERFLRLPSLVEPASLEVAVARLQHVEWESALASAPDDREPGFPSRRSAADVLRRSGWSVVDPLETCATLDSYREYIESSKGEWSVAKNGYVKGRPGWFSCRSACYLAVGRPVVVEDTGFGDVIPTGLGVVAFSSMDEAAAAISDVEANYARHAEAAHDLAAAYFDSDRVLTQLIEQAMATDGDGPSYS